MGGGESLLRVVMLLLLQRSSVANDCFTCLARSSVDFSINEALLSSTANMPDYIVHADPDPRALRFTTSHKTEGGLARSLERLSPNLLLLFDFIAV